MFSYKHATNWEAGTYQGLYYIPTYPIDKNTLVTSNDVKSCREFFVQVYRSRILKNPVDHPAVKKAYVLVTLGKPFYKGRKIWLDRLNSYTERTLYMMNSFERAHKWPLTKVHQVDNKEIPMVFYVGHRKWTMSPYLMSLWTLFIRVGTQSWLPENLMAIPHKALADELYKAASRFNDSCPVQLKASVRDWDTFMSVYHALFRSRPRKYNWSTDHLNGGNARPEGIMKLIGGQTAYKELSNRYKELKHKKEKEANESKEALHARRKG